jgi:inhibitor of cysteine peptidase
MLQVDERQNGRRVELAVGEELEVVLPENPTTGFRWRLQEDGAPACALIEDRPGNAPGPPGRAVSHAWLFRAARQGDVQIELALGRQWEPRPARSFHLDVHVKA